MAERVQALPTVAGFAVKQAVAALQKRGIAVAPLLRRAGLLERALADDSVPHAISSVAQVKVFDLAAEAMEDSAFGMHLALETDPRDAGMLFYVASGAENLGEALSLFARYSRIVNEAMRVQLTRASTGMEV